MTNKLKNIILTERYGWMVSAEEANAVINILEKENEILSLKFKIQGELMEKIQKNMEYDPIDKRENSTEWERGFADGFKTAHKFTRPKWCGGPL